MAMPRLALLCVAASILTTEVYASCQAITEVVSTTATAANISWQVPCNAEVEDYIFRWKEEVSCSVGNLQLVNIQPPLTHHILGGLKAYTQYNCYVDVTFEGGTSRRSTDSNFTTKQAPASSGPMSLVVTKTIYTTVLIEWGGIPCSHRNGEIVHFVLNITLNGEASRLLQVQGNASSGGSYALSELQPGGVYTIAVAAVNSQNQTGVYSMSEEIHIMEAVPGDAPQNFVIQTSPNSPGRALVFSWDPPTMPNSCTLNYTLTCESRVQSLLGPVERAVTHELVGSLAVDSVQLWGFSPSAAYNCSVVAYNAIGTSPAAYASVTLADDAKLFQIAFELPEEQQCREWMKNDLQVKLETLTRELQLVTKRLCDCAVPNDRFSDEQFHCTNTCNYLVYQAVLHGTFARTSSELLAVIESWVRQGTVVLLNVTAEHLHIKKSCNVVISEFGNPVCTKDFECGDDLLLLPLWVIIVAASGLSGVLVVTLLMIMVCCCCGARKCKTKITSRAVVDPHVWVSLDGGLNLEEPHTERQPRHNEGENDCTENRQDRSDIARKLPGVAQKVLRGSQDSSSKQRYAPSPSRDLQEAAQREPDAENIYDDTKSVKKQVEKKSGGIKSDDVGQVEERVYATTTTKGESNAEHIYAEARKTVIGTDHQYAEAQRAAKPADAQQSREDPSKHCHYHPLGEQEPEHQYSSTHMPRGTDK